jgi:MinD-like ATPase involved in chromosome partitioning or flagellar assembly
MRVITFYSFKGGVGRTLACANFGLYLAKTGQKVVLADMDFEAPGLDAKFFPDATTNISNGLLDQITAFQQGAPLPNLSPIPLPLSEEVTRSGGKLHLIPAGNYGALDKYHQVLSSLRWDFLLKTEEGLAFWFDLLERIKTELQPDVLVIDSRTGITEVGGLCTQVLPDTVLLFSSTSPESMKGTRRIYERIRTSQLVKEMRSGASIDVRIVLTRVPRPKDPEAFDRQMKLRLNLEVPKLYYLFADADLATDEYIAMNRSAPNGQSILSDYVDLFAALNPEDTADYVKSRLASFRTGLTLRKEAESRYVIQELLTLFPRSEVYLEAARYYRLVKESEQSILNYVHYLSGVPNHKDIILELAEVCTTVPLASLGDYRDPITRSLALIGPEVMEPATLALFGALTKLPEHLQSIVSSIEGDPAKLTAEVYRRTLFRALDDMGQWEKLAGSATDIDLKDPTLQRILAKAYAKIRAPEKALQIIHRLQLREPTEVMLILEILYDLRGDVGKAELRKAIEGNRRISPYMTRYAASLVDHPTSSHRDDAEFRSWARDLLNERTSTSRTS